MGRVKLCRDAVKKSPHGISVESMDSLTRLMQAALIAAFQSTVR
jgi:hypothetical protein